jgi:hypothetical protein
MRYVLLAAIAYLALMSLWVYGVLDTTESGAVWLLPLIVFVQVAAGFLVGRWPAVVLPVLVVLISIPAGYPPTEEGEPLPLWFDLGFLALFGIPLVGGGVVMRKVYDRGWNGSRDTT